MINLDRILGLVLLTLAVAYGWGAFNFPVAFAGPESVGPATFPKILAFIVGACSLYMLVKPDSLEKVKVSSTRHCRNYSWSSPCWCCTSS